MKYKIFIIVTCILSASCQERYNTNGTSTQSSNSKPRESNNSREISNSSNRSSKSTITPKINKTLNSSGGTELSSLFKKLEPSVFMVYASKGGSSYSQGSGFFIGDDIGVTNSHVLEGANDYVIKIGEKFYQITDILKSSNSDNLDYVIFKINKKINKPLSVAYKTPEIGEDVFAIGSPKGLTNSLTKGTVSGFRENQRIQIDATIDHGSSGGPLFNMKGEVVGITTSGLGTGSDLNFAVNIQAIPFQNYN